MSNYPPGPGEPPRPDRYPTPFLADDEPTTMLPPGGDRPSAGPSQPPPTPPRSRRGVLIGTGVAVVAAAGGFATYAVVRPSTSSSAPPAVTGNTPAGGAAGNVLAEVADIPESGGLVLADAKIVLTRPTADQVKAFTAVCTHQGCLVATVSAGAIHCPCHGSAFDATTGAVVNGPASRPLAAIGITVADGVVRKG